MTTNVSYGMTTVEGAPGWRGGSSRIPTTSQIGEAVSIVEMERIAETLRVVEEGLPTTRAMDGNAT